MRLLPTAIVLLSALYASAQPANQGQILACRSVVTGAEEVSTLKEYGLPPPKNSSLLMGEFCEPLYPITSCAVPFPPGLYCYTPWCLCCDVEEEIEVFTGYIGVDCVRVLT